MGEEVEAHEFTRADRTRYREKVRRCLDVFARMLREARFDTDDPMTGLEVELNLVDEHGDPALKSIEALAAIADPAFQTELGLFNIEINVPPVKLREGGLEKFEELLRRDLNGAETASPRAATTAPRSSAHLETTGTLAQARELAVHRSAYQLKEADPHTWGIPRLDRPGQGRDARDPARRVRRRRSERGPRHAVRTDDAAPSGSTPATARSSTRCRPSR